MTRVRPPSATRIVLLCLAAFVAAIAVHQLVGLAGMDADDPFRLFVTPLVGGIIVYAGLSGYPTAGRLRLSGMVALLLLLFSGAS